MAEKGQADLFILQAMDGTRTLADIARSVRSRYPHLFADDVSTLERVRRLAERYA